MHFKKTAFILLALATVMVPAGIVLAAGDGTPRYVATGDSLVFGVGATAPQVGYVGWFNNHFVRGAIRGPDEMVNLSVSDETSATYISGGQLGNVLSAINDPDTDVRYVTLDIGANDFLGLIGLGKPCEEPTSVACQAAIGAALGDFAVNYQFILANIIGALAANSGDGQLLIMTYYNPFGGTGLPLEVATDLALLGLDGTLDCATGGASGTWGLNDIIACVPLAAGADIVDADDVIGDNALTLTHIAEGDTHLNNAGHRLIAEAFEAVAEQ